jgi:hypothetical protein
MVIGAQRIRLSNGLTTRSAHLRDIENDEAEARSSHDRDGSYAVRASISDSSSIFRVATEF